MMQKFTASLVAATLTCLSGAAQAQAVNNAFTQSIPTLDEFGLIGLVVLVGAAAGWILKRRGSK